MNKTIHRIWLGSKMPDRYRRYGERWKELNPGYMLHDWTEEEIRAIEWRNVAVLQNLDHRARHPNADMIAYYTHLADVLCYEILWQNGGYYFNTDVLPVRPLSHLRQDPMVPGIAIEDDAGNLVNMAMYSPRMHSLFDKILDNLPVRYFGLPGQGMHITTGVGLIMQSVAEYNGALTRWPKDTFNYVHWSSIPVGTYPDLDSIKYPACTVGLHGWSHKKYARGAEVI